MFQRHSRPALLFLLAAFLEACGGSDGGVEPSEPTGIALTTAPSASAQNRIALPVQPVIQLRDAGSGAVARAGTEVTASVAGGSSTLGGMTTVVTASDGSARFTDLVLIGRAGLQTLTFSAAGLASASAIVELTAGVATLLTIDGGDDQYTLPSGVLSTPPSVRAVDADLNGVSGVIVTFVVTAGGGSTVSTSATSNAFGIASAGSWTLGSSVGAHVLEASAPGLSSVTFNATVVEMPVRPSMSIAVAGAHSCALASTGAAYCWGRNESGQVGAAPTTSCTVEGEQGPVVFPCNLVPVAVVGGLSFIWIVGGDSHTCALTSDGTAYCWGSNDLGQLGDNTTTPRTAPGAVATNLKFVSLDAGSKYNCGLTSSGAAYCWGANGNGQLGNGTSGNTILSPVAVAGDLSFRTISAGGHVGGHTCGLTSSGAAYCWGTNGFGQLGIGAKDILRHPVPERAAAGITFMILSAGLGSHTCGLTPGGAAWCWGLNSFGALGNGSTVSSPVPVAAVHSSPFAQLVAGGFIGHTCALQINGAAVCWGENERGQVGNGSTDDISTPSMVVGGISFAVLDAGFRHSCARTAAGLLYCWGSGAAGQLGLNSTSLATAPAQVSGIP